MFRVSQTLASFLPLRAVQALGRQVGSIAFICLPAQRALVEQHLSRAFGDTMAPGQRRRVAAGVFRNIGQTGLEWLKLPSLSVPHIQALVTVEGLEHLQQAAAAGRGVLACSAHFGNWEFIAIYLRSLGFDGALLARKLRYPEYQDFFIDMRAKKGVPTHERGSLREVAHLLRQNKIVGLMPDQDTDGLEGDFVEFFGSPAYTPVGPAALSLITGAAMVPCFMVRENGRFRLVIKPALELAEPVADRRAAIRQLTQQLSRATEDMIRLHPEQWVWMHRRWKTTPQTLTAKASRSSRQPAIVFAALSAALLLGFGAGCGHKDKSKDASQAKGADLPDQQLDGFTLTGYGEDGGKRWELEGKEASLEGQIVTIQKPDGVGFDGPRRAYLTAQEAHVNQTNRNVDLRRDVVVHTSDGLWFFTSQLSWIPDIERAHTDQPVRIETEHMLLRGRGFEGMAQLSDAKLLHDVEVLLNPNGAAVAGAPAGVSAGRKHVTITCDGPLDYEYDKGLVTFHNNVHVIDANGELFSDVLVARMNPDGRTIKIAEATGNVRIAQQGHQAASQKAIYDPSKGKISLVGKPSLQLKQEPGQNPFSIAPKN